MRSFSARIICNMLAAKVVWNEFHVVNIDHMVLAFEFREEPRISDAFQQYVFIVTFGRADLSS